MRGIAPFVAPALLAGLWITLSIATVLTIADTPRALEPRAPFTMHEEIVVVAPRPEPVDAGRARPQDLEGLPVR